MNASRLLAQPFHWSHAITRLELSSAAVVLLVKFITFHIFTKNVGIINCFISTAGYTGSGFSCTDINECLTQNGGCSVQPMVACINSLGSSNCGPCPPGYAGDGKICTFVGKCNVDNGGCHANARCQGIFSST